MNRTVDHHAVATLFVIMPFVHNSWRGIPHLDGDRQCHLRWLGTLGLLPQVCHDHGDITSPNDINAGKPMGMANSDGSKLTLPGATSIILFLILYLAVFISSQYWLAHKTDEQLHYLLKMTVVATLVCLLSDQIVNTMKTF